jgi:hypothetical protein
LVQQGLEVMERGIRLEPDYRVLEALPRLAAAVPAHAIDLLWRILLADPDPISVLGSVDEVSETLRIVLASGDGPAADKARDVLDVLVARGLDEFRRLQG